MKVTVDWLKEFVDFSWSAQELAYRLTMAGLEAWSCEPVNGVVPIELEITSNRCDWLSVLGVAREIAGLLRRQISPPKIKSYEKGSPDFDLKVEEGSALRYFGMRIDGVKVAPSPQWMQNRLIACGIRPINNLVDITNYVMLLFGQPLHCFDFDKLTGGLLSVRKAESEEITTTLDGEERVLENTDIVIADAEKVVAIAGIMGSENSEVSEATTRILLESALFPRVEIRRSRQRLGMNTEASYRFERGVDPVGVELACFYAVSLIEKLAGGKVIGYQVYDDCKLENRVICLPKRTLVEISEINVPDKDVEGILSGLGFGVSIKSDEIIVEVPSFRQDVAFAEDIIEEVLRICGYDKIPVKLPKIGVNNLRGKYNYQKKIFQKIKGILEARGFNEAISFSLISEKERSLLFEDRELFSVENTISLDYLYLRPSALPGLLSAVKLNFSYQNKEVCLYEISQAFPDKKSKTELTEERYVLSVVAVDKDMDSAFRKIKRVVEDLFDKDEVEIVKGTDRRFVSFSKLLVNGKQIGFLGKIIKRLCSEYGIDYAIFYLELDLNIYLEVIRNRKISYSALPLYPAVERDISMWVDQRKYSHQEIVKQIKKVGADYLRKVELIDLYRSKEGRVSYAYRLYFGVDDRTLREEEIEPVFNRIIDKLKRLGLELRVA